MLLREKSHIIKKHENPKNVNNMDIGVQYASGVKIVVSWEESWVQFKSECTITE